MFGFSYRKLKESHEGPWLFLDLLMLGLLIINLLWIIFDTLYEAQAFKQLLASISPQIVTGYAPIHENFLLIDLVFIAIFLSEFCLRWAVAVYRKEYMRWYFFPFIHWYDLVGCIPVSSARIFRFLRIFSILYRLQRYNIIDLKNTAFFRFIAFYYNVFVEELSDRIVVKVLSDAQRDLAEGTPLIADISQKVLAKRQPVICQWAAAMAQHFGESIEHPINGETFRTHVQDAVGKAVRHNSQMSTLKMVPVLGGTIERTLEDAITDIVTHSVINLLKDVTPEKISEFIDHGINQFDAEEEALEDEVLLVVSEVLELLKEHVAQQRWKTELAAKTAVTPASSIPNKP